MAFRTRAPIDANQHKGLVVQNDNGLGGLLIPSGRSLTGSIPIDVSVVDGSGNQVTSFGSGSSLPSTVVNGQQTVTGTATALPSQALTNGVLIENLSTNSGGNAVSVFIGSSSVTATGSTGGYELQVGATTSAAVANTNGLYVICASGSPIITWIGS